MIEQTHESSISSEFARTNDTVVVVAGIPFGKSGSTNNLRVLKLD